MFNGLTGLYELSFGPIFWNVSVKFELLSPFEGQFTFKNFEQFVEGEQKFMTLLKKAVNNIFFIST